MHHIYIGATSEPDAGTVGHDLGAASLNYGNQDSYLNAMVAYINSHGGLFGRTLVPVVYDVSSVEHTNTSAQAACTDLERISR